MAQWRPDPTFCPSPKMAMPAAPERLAFVTMLNPRGQGASDALTMIDVGTGSKSDGQLVGRVAAHRVVSL